MHCSAVANDDDYICSKDAFDMILCGCSAIQVGTCFWTEGEKVRTASADSILAVSVSNPS